MTIHSIKINNFRNLATLDLSPAPQGLNIICGNNGSGKTSLLEAIHFLSLGRSFRTSTASRLIRHTAEKFSVFAQIVSETERHIPVGVERDLQGATRLRIAEQDAASVMELANCLPLRIINSQSHQLFESGPIFRRKYLDWGLFYQFESFISCWRQFERVLKQRNAVLRDRRPKRELEVWTEELIKHGLALDQLRQSYVAELTPLIQQTTQTLLGKIQLEMRYYPGWDQSLDFATALNQAFPEECRLGYTQYGPHRADFDVIIDGVSAKYFLSRGQQKLLICAMIIAQGMLLNEGRNKRLVYLVDDLPAELDQHSRDKLISLLTQQETQVFITAIEPELVGGEEKKKVFHVEQGRLMG
jgi:DNA replication and repair protein RecF